MKKYLLDANIMTAFLKGRPGVAPLAPTWFRNDAAATSIIGYGEAVEYFKGLTSYLHDLAKLQMLLQIAPPYPLTYPIMERYADLRRAMRPPYGPGLIGDIDTLIAATALEHNLTLVTTDSDFTRVPGLSLQHIPRDTLKRRGTTE